MPITAIWDSTGRPFRETLRRLRRNRRGQVLFAKIICAARFKFFREGGELLRVCCPNGCGRIDSFDHLLDCFKVGKVNPERPFEEKVSFLSNMAINAAKNRPILPNPFLELLEHASRKWIKSS